MCNYLINKISNTVSNIFRVRNSLWVKNMLRKYIWGKYSELNVTYIRFFFLFPALYFVVTMRDVIIKIRDGSFKIGRVRESGGLEKKTVSNVKSKCVFTGIRESSGLWTWN